MLEVLTGILVFITAFYAWATFRILRANERVVDVMKRQAEAITRPYIQVVPYMKPSDPYFYLRIINTGQTSALNLSLSLDKDVYQDGRKLPEFDLATFGAFRQQIDSFPPGGAIEYVIVNAYKLSNESNEELVPTRFCVTAEYSYQDKSVKEKNMIDLRPYMDFPLPQDQFSSIMRDVTRTLEKIATVIGRKKNV
jgi:hypothetical protein